MLIWRPICLACVTPLTVLVGLPPILIPLMEIVKRYRMRIILLPSVYDLILTSPLIRVSLYRMIITAMFPIISIFVFILPRSPIFLLWLSVISFSWTLVVPFVNRRPVLFLMLMLPPLLMQEIMYPKYVVCIKDVQCIILEISTIMKVHLLLPRLLFLARTLLLQLLVPPILLENFGGLLCYPLDLTILVMHLSHLLTILYREVFIWFSSIRVLVPCMLVLINAILKTLMVTEVLLFHRHRDVLI